MNSSIIGQCGRAEGANPSRERSKATLDLPHHKLIGRLEECVNVTTPKRWKNVLSICTNFNMTGAIPQQKPRMMMSVCQQPGKPTTLSTSELHRAPSLQLAAELSSFKFGQLSSDDRFR